MTLSVELTGSIFNCRLFRNRFPVCLNIFVFLFLLTPCLVVAFQPCMEWIPIKKKSSNLHIWVNIFGKYQANNKRYFRLNLGCHLWLLGVSLIFACVEGTIKTSSCFSQFSKKLNKLNLFTPIWIKTSVSRIFRSFLK